MNKDQKQAGHHRSDDYKPDAIAYSGAVTAPVWLNDTLEAGVPRLGFLFVRVDEDCDSSGLFRPTDLFDMLVVIQMLAEKTCCLPHVDAELRLRLENVAIELAILRKRQDDVKKRIREHLERYSPKDDSSK